MSKRNRRRYDDEFRASAVLMLEAAGYPDREGALTAVAKKLGTPHNTIRNWFHAVHNPAPAKIRHEKKFNLITELTELLGLHIQEAKMAVTESGLGDLDRGIGILIDKLQLLQGKPTWIGEIKDLVDSGRMTMAEIREELGEELAQELFDTAGIQRTAN